MSKITKLKIRDFRGITALDITAAEINLFAGDNAQGKTSVLDAIAAALRGKVPADAVRHDQERAEILVELDDGTSIHRKIKADGKQTVKVQKDAATLRAPQGFLDDLFSTEGLNPIDFIKSGDRQKRLLEALPVKTTPEEVLAHLEKCGLDKADVKGLRTESAHAFEVFEAVAKLLSGTRKEANAQVKQAKQWIKQERADLEDATDPSDEIEKLTGDLATARAAVAGRSEKLQRLETMQTRQAGLRESIEEARKRLADLEQQATDLDSEIDTLEAEVAATPDTPESTGEQVADMEARLAELKEQKGAWDQMQRRVGKVEARETELADMEARAKALDTGVKFFRKEAPALALASTPMPVEGLEYKDGAFYVNGTNLDQLSGAETIRVAVKFTLERVRQKGLHVVCVDGVEGLAGSQREQFFSEMAESGVQLWATEVDHGQSAAPDGEGSLFVIMQNGEPVEVQGDVAQPAEDQQESSQAGLQF